MSKTRVVTTHVPIETAANLDAIAKQLDRPRAWIVKQAISRWIEEYRHQRTLEGLADVDAGRTIPHEEVEKWVESLGTDNPLPKPEPKQCE